MYTAYHYAQQQHNYSMTQQDDPKIGRYVKTKFTPEEDTALTRLVTSLGTSNWKRVASLMGTRNARQCRERWSNYLDPELKRHEWTPLEDALLREKVSEYGSRWHTMAQFFNSRSPLSLRNRWQKMERRSDKGNQPSGAMSPVFVPTPQSLPPPPPHAAEPEPEPQAMPEPPRPAEDPLALFDLFSTDTHFLDENPFDLWSGFSF
jgi:hypothetical protein